jgi:hypothetical protein
VGNPGNAVAFHGLERSDLNLLATLQQSLLSRDAAVPGWGETDAGTLRQFHDQVRQLLRPHVSPSRLDDVAVRLADSLCGIGLL